MSKFQSIQQNRFGAVQHRSLKQILQQHKEEVERMKEPKCEPKCIEQYKNPYCQNNNHSNCSAYEKLVCITEEALHSDEDCKLTENEEKSNEDLPLHDQPNVNVELPVIYDNPKTTDEIKPVEVETEVENIKTEMKRKQSLKDVVKLSYKHFLNKEFSGSV